MKIFSTSLILMGLFFLGCSQMLTKGQLKQMLKEDPSILTEAIEAHPEDFIISLQKISQTARAAMAKQQAAEDKQKREQAIIRPLSPEIRKDEAVRGTRGAPITLVEYSDFECPYCSRGYATVMELLKKYDGKIQFIFKHLPLSIHQNAMMAASYYEALRMQNEQMAFKFHDAIFRDQGKMRNGEGFFKAIAKQIGADISRLAKDLKSEEISARIAADQTEAIKMGLGDGTPGFLLNGIPVQGAQNASYFIELIEDLKARGRIQI
ncbi:MAG: thiol:disulfide interchange protein [Bdellovibrionales bacterium RIFOXYD12_FULL_39_22]|nr:MAG: thiol:disulfide interchange protein [Bdellovibrionales bacterium RIFOXYB1_FULL_39_21]OFZ41046.1 MAG: thiol:disulfide interchange protein [Bdellovibrionales bacterium RIFOXYC12_FULL_39_17]OFZ50259.1 MAG: thiol:disulfide interchange protein [Bdellovibrionales bacterium RIFOXYC1_FULL_39_130]OFZ75060.1 MAG: thiol:disulfide interchange protein [Bdellovibrionales bacterium RIFOXYD1_FULL_39_84]OFZ92298.1 MAG: thiol:disulfide interchange protein [Bdellovibrionales bacterium RIFOXYD12_FULL_39_22